MMGVLSRETIAKARRTTHRALARGKDAEAGVAVVDLTEQTEPITLFGLLAAIRRYHREHGTKPDALLLNEAQTVQFYDQLAVNWDGRPTSAPNTWQGVEIRTQFG